MLRRLLAQFGLTALVVALGAGAALADASPTTPSSNDPGQTVVSTNSNITISNSDSSSTSVGSGNGNGPGSTSGSGSSASNGSGSSVTPGSEGSNGSGAVSTTTGSGSAATVQSPVISDPNHSDDTPSFLQLSSNSPVNQTIVAASHSSLVASIERTAYISGLSPIVPVAAAQLPDSVHHHTPPPAPPVGLLHQLHVLLISTLVPASKVLPSALATTHTAATALMLPTMVLLALMARGQLPLLTSYTARLRRSGFLGAARSDVAAAISTFATPREMSSIAASVP